MQKNKWFVLIGLLVNITFFFSFSAAAENLAGDDYKIGKGDVLDISVWKNADLSKVVPVLPDGSISFPLVGKIQASGMTLLEFQNNLSEKLIKYMPNLFLLLSSKPISRFMLPAR